jgi:hypothetical protein
VFRPLDSSNLLELPLHVQDTSLFYPGRMHLSEDQAWETCERVQESAAAHGGVLTLSWHTRSFGPERLWGAFYKRLLAAVRERPVWFGCARDVVGWFEQRRCTTFESVNRDGETVEVRLTCTQAVSSPGLLVRVHLTPHEHLDFPWDDGIEKVVATRLARSR